MPTGKELSCFSQLFEFGYPVIGYKKRPSPAKAKEKRTIKHVIMPIPKPGPKAKKNIYSKAYSELFRISKTETFANG